MERCNNLLKVIKLVSVKARSPHQMSSVFLMKPQLITVPLCNLILMCIMDLTAYTCEQGSGEEKGGNKYVLSSY